jgi:hypothetical protein
VWSWGWATYSAAGSDPDKPYAACVWLWAARGPQFCDAPKYVQPAFDESLTEGQVVDLPPGARCQLPDGQRIDRNAVGRLTALTGDPDYAASALLERAVLRATQTVPVADVRSAERAVIAASFRGSRATYLAALARARLTLPDAQAIIADDLARDEIEARFRPQPPPAAQVRDFLSTYAAEPARLVKTTRPAPWLDGASRGWVVSTLGPQDVIDLAGPATVDTADGSFDVMPLGPALPLALLAPTAADGVARAALDRFAHESAYDGWLRSQEQAQLAGALCVGDNLPAASGATDLDALAPFLAP